MQSFESLIEQELIKGHEFGRAAKAGLTPKDLDAKTLKQIHRVESEHSNDKDVQELIGADHVAEYSDYYDALDDMEKKLEDEKREKEKKMSPLKEANEEFGGVTLEDAPNANPDLTPELDPKEDEPKFDVENDKLLWNIESYKILASRQLYVYVADSRISYDCYSGSIKRSGMVQKGILSK